MFEIDELAKIFDYVIVSPGVSPDNIFLDKLFYKTFYFVILIYYILNFLMLFVLELRELMERVHLLHFCKELSIPAVLIMFLVAILVFAIT